MAGGNESPRQKMIGMMYLVLTALLALQVSNAVLEKFAIINGTLEELIVDNTVKNTTQLSQIVKDGSTSQDKGVKEAVANAQEVRKLSEATVKYISEVKTKMMTEAGSTAVDEKFINDHSSKVAVMMMNKESSGVGAGFKKRLEEYRTQLEKLSGRKFETLARAPKDIPAFAHDEKHANKDFLEFTFENTPPVAAYASVTQIQTEVLEYEALALDELAKKAGAKIIKFDKVVPMVRPVSSIVAAGAKYEASMFITASASGLVPDMYYNGNKLQVFDDPSGVKMGKVEFVAKGGNYDAQGLSKQSFDAKIVINGEPHEQKIEYFVAQPVIRVTTGNAPTLYMNCGNTVNIEVPALGTNYKPSFSSQGAEIITGDRPGRVVIIPSQRKISVSVSNAGTPIGTQPFDVKSIPRPRYIPKDNSGKEISQKDGVRGSSLTGMRIVAEPEENFKQEVPKDAVYRVRSMDVIHARGTSPINRITATNENIDMSSWRSQFKPGDRIVIEIKSVTRRTYKGSDEKVEVKSEIINVPIQ